MMFEIGDTRPVVPLSQRSDGSWVVRLYGLATGWTCVLRNKDADAVREAHPVDARILRIDSGRRSIEVGVSQFGMMPVSDRMRPRYLKASREVASVLRGTMEPAASVAESFSEVKGLLNRCIRHDQWDWMTVYELLGRPTLGDLSRMADIVADLARSVRKGELEPIVEGLQKLKTTQLLALLDGFESKLAEEAVTLGSPVVTPTPRTISSRPADVSRQVLSSYEKQKLTDATEAHERVLAILRQALLPQGCAVEANVFIDAFARLKTGPAVFEAKSVTSDNELSQVRSAVSQLYEYRYRHQLKNASLWIVLSKAPTEEWIAGYLEMDRDIRLLWIEDGRIAGPSADRLFESGATARQRNASSGGNGA